MARTRERRSPVRSGAPSNHRVTTDKGRVTPRDRFDVTIDDGTRVTVRRFATLRSAERLVDQLAESGATFRHTITKRIVRGASHAARPA